MCQIININHSNQLTSRLHDPIQAQITSHTFTHKPCPLPTDDTTRSTTYGSGREGSGDGVHGGPAGPTRRSRRLMSLTDQHTSDVKHGSTREVYDGSTVCVQADVHTAAGRHDTYGLWDDVMDPLGQPRLEQLQRDDGSDWDLRA